MDAAAGPGHRGDHEATVAEAVEVSKDGPGRHVELTCEVLDAPVRSQPQQPDQLVEACRDRHVDTVPPSVTGSVTDASYGRSMNHDDNDMTLDRTPVNPWGWSQQLGYNQAEIVEGATRYLVCAGQTSVDAHGAPQHPGDMRSQIALALDNLETVVGAAGMTLADIIRLNVFTTDVDEAMRHLDVLGGRLGPIGVAPPMTLLGVTRLALPDLMFEIEATAAD
ncbi:MAG TPA: RidA family protein [Acidimicrobiales bacterium]|nr:RidA family protein [Acidimicrobiales bacterium]